VPVAKLKNVSPEFLRASMNFRPERPGRSSVPVQNFRGGRCFWKQSLQYTGRPSVGLNGTSQSFPQSEHFAGCISRGPPKPPPPPRLLSPLSPNSMFLTLYFFDIALENHVRSLRPCGAASFEPPSSMVCRAVYYFSSM